MAALQVPAIYILGGAKLLPNRDNMIISNSEYSKDKIKANNNVDFTVVYKPLLQINQKQTVATVGKTAKKLETELTCTVSRSPALAASKNL